MICRGCEAPVPEDSVFCDLGMQPLANALLTEEDLQRPERTYPLRPLVCPSCLLVQLPAPDPEAIFTEDYPFFAGQSVTWMRHCRELADELIRRCRLGATSRVLDIGSNDGTMLRRFRGKGIPAIGIEPCASVAQHALMEGLATIVDFWGADCARRLLRTQGIPLGKGWRADLVIATNVLAHVPDIHDFLTGVREILAPAGRAVFEVSYLGALVGEGAYDQVYAEHHSYFCLASLDAALSRADLQLVDAELLPLHGGSLRVTAAASGTGLKPVHSREDGWEPGCSLQELRDFARVPDRARSTARAVLADLAGRRVAGYGASAKTTVTVNHCGIGPDHLPYIADTTLSKQGKYVPGARIPIVSPARLRHDQPDVIVNFCWNWREESERNIRRACPDAEIVYLH